MNTQHTDKKDLYYSKDHEWIDFQGTIAYVGVSRFKLTGFKQIQEIIFSETTGFKKQGEVIATIKYNDYKIEAHMPVDGKLLHVNNELIFDNPNILLNSSENSSWIAMIVPSQPYERKDLLISKQYQMNHKNKYAK